MRIRITREHGRHRIICIRADGSFTQSETGPSLPHHDLAHYVAERALGLTSGFFGQIEAGRSIAELSDPQVIRTLPREAWQAEVLARTLQGSNSGAVKPDQVQDLLAAEEGKELCISPDQAERMELTFRDLLREWQEVPEGGSLELIW